MKNLKEILGKPAGRNRKAQQHCVFVPNVNKCSFYNFMPYFEQQRTNIFEAINWICDKHLGYASE